MEGVKDWSVRRVQQTSLLSHPDQDKEIRGGMILCVLRTPALRGGEWNYYHVVTHENIQLYLDKFNICFIVEQRRKTACKSECDVMEEFKLEKEEARKEGEEVKCVKEGGVNQWSD